MMGTISKILTFFLNVYVIMFTCWMQLNDYILMYFHHILKSYIFMVVHNVVIVDTVEPICAMQVEIMSLSL